jgi:hypothetical protein
MCDFSGRLVAGMDGELAENEAADVQRHLWTCVECRERVSAYAELTREFAAYYNAATQLATLMKIHPRLPRWIPVAVGAVAAAAAAVVLMLLLLPRSVEQLPAIPQVEVAYPPLTVKPATQPVKAVQRRQVSARRKPPAADFAPAGPAIQIAIPADAMFPPGAVPAGVNFVANLSLADGSLQEVRLQR